MKKSTLINRLKDETSPYLLQHAGNPVHWQPWDDKALEFAQKENRLLLISIGYSSCHWCHVMEHESFEDESVAEVMNQHYVNIKVDREERPDIDQVYMNAVQLMTGRGGWPLNCIALPDGRPVWGGTYFQKEQWKKALLQISELYQNKPEEVIDYAEKLTEGVLQSDLVTLNTSDDDINIRFLDEVVDEWRPYMDVDLGGRRGAPKFPMPSNYHFLLRYATQRNDKDVMEFVKLSLNQIAKGGINDHVGGGFSRYSVDKKWHVPHFEKMLYDNGQLVSLYAEAYQATKAPLYKQTVYETLEFIAREMTTEEGAFYSALDADSLNEKDELEEGAYYVWKEQELTRIIGKEYDYFKRYYNVNHYGFWEHDNYVLIKRDDDELLAAEFGVSVSELLKKDKSWKSLLLEERSKRTYPRLDSKALTSWNALMLKGYVDAYKVFNEQKFLDAAEKNAKFILSKQLQEDGTIYRSYIDGESSINGFLEDYAAVIDAFISLYEVSFKEVWLQYAKQLADYSFDHFFNLENGMFYFTSEKEEALIARKLEVEDNVISSSNSIMARNLFKLGHYYSNSYYLKVSRQMVKNVTHKMKAYGSGYANWLQLICDFAGNFYEVAFTGSEAKNMLQEFNQKYIPNKLMAGAELKSTIPILEGRLMENDSYIYVCEEGSCKLPVTQVEKAIKQIDISFK